MLGLRMSVADPWQHVPYMAPFFRKQSEMKKSTRRHLALAFPWLSCSSSVDSILSIEKCDPILAPKLYTSSEILLFHVTPKFFLVFSLNSTSKICHFLILLLHFYLSSQPPLHFSGHKTLINFC